MIYLHDSHKILLSDWLSEHCSQSESRDFVAMVWTYHVGTHFKALKKFFVMKLAFFFEFTEVDI